jgi:hypothetical protein
MVGGWLLVIAVAFMAPTLVHGTVFAPFDLLNVFGLGHHSSAVVHNIVDSDLIQQGVPWLKLDWTQIHSGHLPLWNPFNAGGLPLGLDFVSATFSLPSVISYIFPVQDGLLVSALVKLFIAGTGAYALGRVLGLRRSSSVLVGTVFELSGAFTVWLGWSQTGVMAWAGWLFAGAYLVVRGERRVRSIILFAVVFGLSILGGHPESTLILTASTAIFAAALIVGRAERPLRWRPFLRPVGDLSFGVAAGLGLSAPLWIPATQLATGSTRFRGTSGVGALPARDLVNFVFQGFDGLPVGHSIYLNPGNYYEVTAFLGVIPLALAGLAVLTRWRQSEVIALSLVLVATLAVVFVAPVVAVVDRLPHGDGVNLTRALIPASLVVAALAGMGLDVVLDRRNRKSVQWKLGGLFGFAAIILLGLGIDVAINAHRLPKGFAEVREKSFVWPGLGTVVGLAIVALLVVVRRKEDRREAGKDAGDGRFASVVTYRRVACWSGIALVAVETLFLVLAGGPLWTAGQPYFQATPGETALEKAVGSSTVGFGACPVLNQFPDLGILPDANIGYNVHEFAFFDAPVAPRSYYTSWGQATRTKVAPLGGGFCPAISTVALARRYGVSYILEPPGVQGPVGTKFRGSVGDEGLFFVPGAASATLASLSQAASQDERDTGAGVQVKVSHPDDATWHMNVTASGPSVLYLRLTSVPGWRATVDGHPVPIRTWDSAMQKIAIPSGRHVVVVTYWPEGFKLGFELAAITVAVLILSAVIARRRRVDDHSGDS